MARRFGGRPCEVERTGTYTYCMASYGTRRGARARNRERWRMLRRALAWIGLAAALALAGPAGAQGGYFSAPFSETTHTPAFGQAPVFVPHSNPQLVVFGKDYKTGEKN